MRWMFLPMPLVRKTEDSRRATLPEVSFKKRKPIKKETQTSLTAAWVPVRCGIAELLAIHRPHDDVDAAQDGHDVGYLYTFQQVGQNLQVIEIGWTNLESPGESIIVAYDKDSQFTLAAFHAHVGLNRREF